MTMDTDSTMDPMIQCRWKVSWRRVKGTVSNIAGWAMNFLHSPAMLNEFEYVDPISDQTVYLSTGARYSVLHIGSLKLFFDRATGSLDGTCRSLEERIADRFELLD
jgi:hypothetical protein